MPDICLCINKECTRNKSCYRFMAIPSFAQYYGDFRLVDDYNECPLFLEIGNRRIRSEYVDEKASKETSEALNQNN